jgi:hypothetical protein
MFANRLTLVPFLIKLKNHNNLILYDNINNLDNELNDLQYFKKNIFMSRVKKKKIQWITSVM